MAAWFGLLSPVTCPAYFAKLTDLAELTAPADGSATAGAFHKKVGGACCACFSAAVSMLFSYIQIRHCHAKDPGLNLKKVMAENIFFEVNVSQRAED